MHLERESRNCAIVKEIFVVPEKICIQIGSRAGGVRFRVCNPIVDGDDGVDTPWNWTTNGHTGVCARRVEQTKERDR